MPTGTGPNRPFVSVNLPARFPRQPCSSPNCSGIARARFTGAVSDRKGKFESAHTGTIFLDEIGELPLAGQVEAACVCWKAHEIQRVGNRDQPIRVDTRVVAATNRNLRKTERRRPVFREDLFYRLGVIHVTLPPLRERKDEIPLFVPILRRRSGRGASKRRPIEMSRRVTCISCSTTLIRAISASLRNIILPGVMSCRGRRPISSTCPPTPVPRRRPNPHRIRHRVDEGRSLNGGCAGARPSVPQSDLAEAGVPRARTAGSGRHCGPRLAKRCDMNRSHLSGAAEEARHSCEGVFVRGP